VLADVASAGYRSQPAGAIDYTRALRSPGSTLKPFLYALGLQRGLIAPQDIMADQPEGAAGISNADHDFLGPLLPRQALANSRNVPATNLLRRIGLPEGFAFLRRLGLHQMDGPAERFGLAMAIGALPTSLDRLMRAYTTLAEDGGDADLVWLEGAAADSQPLISADAARLVGRFLSDPMARLPSFPRYGSSEFPFAVALKTGTSQGYRDAWTVAWSRDYVVGVWVGRADAGPMTQLSGARAAGQLAQAVMLRLHGAGRADLLAGEFAAPAGRQATELCPDPACSQRLTEWVDPGVPRSPGAAAQLAIVQPEPDSHVWRNPETPAALNRLVLRASAGPQVKQIVWLVDGRPIAVGAPDAPLYWTMVPGRHRWRWWWSSAAPSSGSWCEVSPPAARLAWPGLPRSRRRWAARMPPGATAILGRRRPRRPRFCRLTCAGGWCWSRRRRLPRWMRTAPRRTSSCRRFSGGAISRATWKLGPACGRRISGWLRRGMTRWRLTRRCAAASRMPSPGGRGSMASTIGRESWWRPTGCITTRGCGSPRSGSLPCGCRGRWGRISSCGT
jgi:hypothetical protein